MYLQDTLFYKYTTQKGQTSKLGALPIDCKWNICKFHCVSNSSIASCHGNWDTSNIWTEVRLLSLITVLHVSKMVEVHLLSLINVLHVWKSVVSACWRADYTQVVNVSSWYRHWNDIEKKNHLLVSSSQPNTQTCIPSVQMHYTVILNLQWNIYNDYSRRTIFFELAQAIVILFYSPLK